MQERNTYYPSGLQIDALSSTAAGTSDYTAGWANGQRIPAFAAYAGQLHGRRYLDPAISSWYAVEPLATKFAGVSPYNYALGDPVNLRDATGMEPDGLSYNAHEINSMTYSERRQLGLVWSFAGLGYVAPGVDWTNPFGIAAIAETEERTRTVNTKAHWHNYGGSSGSLWGYVRGGSREETYTVTTWHYEAQARLASGIPGGFGGGNNTPQYSGYGPLSTATAMGPGGDGLAYFQFGLDLIGSAEFPGISTAADLFSGGISWFQGDYFGATLSGGGALLPFLSQIKAARTFVKLVGHHVIPKFMGGAVKQVLARIPESVHKEFHSVLHKRLKEAGMPNVGGVSGSTEVWRSFLNRSPEKMTEAFDILLKTTLEFDLKHGTKMGEILFDELKKHF